MIKRIGPIVAREIREALPPTVFFLFLLHMVALTKAVALEDHSLGGLRTAGATLGALIVAKAILVVEALPITRLVAGRLVTQVLWKTLLYGTVVLLFRVVEETIPLASRHGGLRPAAAAMYGEIAWPMFGVLALWIVGGLLLYCLVAELVQAVGRERVVHLLFRSRIESPKR